jgi:hypothetical protein
MTLDGALTQAAACENGAGLRLSLRGHGQLMSNSLPSGSRIPTA